MCRTATHCKRALVCSERFCALAELQCHAPWVLHHYERRTVRQLVFNEKRRANFFEALAIDLRIFRDKRHVKNQRVGVLVIWHRRRWIAVQLDNHPPRFVGKKVGKGRVFSTARHGQAQILNPPFCLSANVRNVECEMFKYHGVQLWRKRLIRPTASSPASSSR